MKLAGADDPATAADDERNQTRERVAAMRPTLFVWRIVALAAVRHVKSACRIFSKLNLDQKREVISQFQKEVADAEARITEGSQAQAIT